MENPGVVRTLLLTDLVGSTALVERLGDARASELFARTDRVARDLFAQFAGREVDKSDGFLALFERPIDAVPYALAYHGALRALSAECGEAIAARAGIHLGEVILKENPAEDVARGAKRLEATGAAVPTCARVMALAQGGQTLLTRGAFDVARTAARGSSAVPDGTDWVAHGPYVLKGIEEPVDVFEAGVRGVAPLQPPPDSEKARRAVAAGDEVTLGWRPAPGLEIEARPNWVLREKLGEGGFGEVWLVEHRKTHERRVYKFCFQADRLRGLKREVVLFRVLKETLGDRDDIAKVIDWNFEAAPFFIESEYTEGGNLLEWAESQGGIANVPLEVRLEIVAQVAEAVGAAHSVGVLHKDIKPSNILVRKGGMAVPAMPEGGTGVPPLRAGQGDATGNTSSPAPRIVLTDFGIGLITDRSLIEAKGITASGMTESVAGDPSSSRTGTRLYMAPELIEGRPATIQSDVYALGVMLYQAVTGDFGRALSSDWREDIGDELLREDIAACLARDTGRRLASAGDVASRLRTLGGRREEAERQRRERADAEAAKLALEKARRRRKVFAASLVVGWAVLLALTAGVAHLADARKVAERERRKAEDREWEARRAQNVARAALAESEIQKARAVEARDDAEAILAFVADEVLVELKAVNLLDPIDSVTSASLDYFRRLSGSDRSPASHLREANVAAARGEMHRLRGESAEAVRWLKVSLDICARDLDWGESQRNRGLMQASVSGALSAVAISRGDSDLALSSASEGWHAAKALLLEEPSREDSQLVAAASGLRLSRVLASRGKVSEAQTRILEAITLLERSNISAMKPALKRELAVAYGLLGELQSSTSQLGPAAVSIRRSLELGESVLATNPSNPVWRRDVGVAWSRLGNILRDSADLAGAIECYENELAGLRELIAEEPGNARWLRGEALCLSLLGAAHLARGVTAKARECHSSSLASFEKLVRLDPSNKEWKSSQIDQLSWLGKVEEAEGNWVGALELYRAAASEQEVVAAAEDSQPDDWRKLAVFLHSLGQALLKTGTEEDALNAFARSGEVMEELTRSPVALPRWRVDLSITLSSRARVWAHRGDFARAHELGERALGIVEEVFQTYPGQSDFAKAYLSQSLEFASLCDKMNRRPDAIDAVERAISKTRRNIAPGSPLEPELIRLEELLVELERN